MRKTNKNSDLDSNPIKTYLALGDSYTIGEGVVTEDRWPDQLKSTLKLKTNKDFDVHYIAQTGWTTSNLIKRIQSEDPAKADLVSLLIGVNNQYQGLSFTAFQKEFDALLATAKSLCKKKKSLFVVSIPDYGYTPFGSGNKEYISKELDEYNKYMQERCEKEKIPFVDITPISRELSIKEGGLNADELHPSPSQYKAWVEKILPVVIGLNP